MYKTTIFCSTECVAKYHQKPNDIIIKSDYAIIRVNSNKYGVVDFLIDIEDIEKISNVKWCVSCGEFEPQRKYATGICRITKKRVSLHRTITNCSDGLVVDHINRNTLDNRKQNLRNVTYKVNSSNRTPCKKRVLKIKKENLESINEKKEGTGMKRKIIRSGNSIMINIPKAILELLGLKVGSEIDLTIDKKNNIVISKGE